MKRAWMLVSVLLALLAGCAECAVAQAPPAVTTVQDTVYTASGATASGTVLVSWSGFTTASGTVVPAGTTSATIGTGGLLSITLAPNAGATPIGSYYTATFHLSDGTTSREYWVIPVTVAGGSPVKLAAIQNEVLPTSVAMQTVSKAYVDTAIATAVNAARLTVFGPSGSSHAPGIVPDPGATAGATRFLREDGTWDAPPGGGLGTMATQNASAVAITGGTITGATITGTGLPTGCAQLPCMLASKASATYTAPYGYFTLIAVPSTPSAGSNYCVTGSINTTVAGSGGSGNAIISLYFTDMSSMNHFDQIGNTIDLTALGSNSSGIAGSSQACFTAKPGSTVQMQFAGAGPTATGYTYQAAAQLTDMGP